MRKSRLSAYKFAAACAFCAVLGILVSPLDRSALVFTVFWGNLAVAETCWQLTNYGNNTRQRKNCKKLIMYRFEIPEFRRI